MAVLTQNVLTWTLPTGDIAQTSVWANFSGAPSAGQALTVFDTRFMGAFWPSSSGGIRAYYDTATTLVQLQTRTVNAATGRVIATASMSYTRTGNTSGNPLPAEVAIVTSLRTTLAGASYRGRLYLPAPKASYLTSVGNLDPTALSAIVNAVAAGLTALNGDTTYGTTNCVVYSRKLHTPTNIVSCDVGNVFDAQRRRRNSISEARTSVTI